MAKQKINKRKNTALESHKKSDKAKWAITFISLILIATLLGGLSFYIVNNNKTNNPSNDSSNSSIYFNYRDVILNEDEGLVELSKFNNRELSASNQGRGPVFLVKDFYFNFISADKNLSFYTPCLVGYSSMLDFNSSCYFEYLFSINLSKLFNINNLLIKLPNCTNNYDNFINKVVYTYSHSGSSYDVECIYSYRLNDNKDIILSFDITGETASEDYFLEDFETNLVIDINI